MSAQHVVEILTDHQNLTYFRQPQKLNRRQARWVTELSLYDFKLVHRPGRLNTQADLLSRRPDHDMGGDNNKDVTVLKTEWFRALPADNDGFLTRIRKHIKNLDASVEEALKENHKDWTRHDGLILFQGRIYVPRDARLQEDILKSHHDSPLAGHPGQHKTRELITHDYWWPRVATTHASMLRDVKPVNERNQIANPLRLLFIHIRYRHDHGRSSHMISLLDSWFLQDSMLS
jgi:hypothetical protein